MLKIGEIPNIKYSEVEQTNPLRWVVLYKEEDGSFTPQTGLIKCKDFFNDIVGKYYDNAGQIYGFDSNKVKVNDDGVWFLLKNVKGEWFEKNLNGLILPLLNEAFGEPHCQLDVIKQGKDYVVKFSREIFSSTYYVSLLAFLIRVSSMKYEHKDLKDMFTNESNPCHKLESIKDPTGNITKWGFKLPEAAKEYWFYAGETMNSRTHANIAKTYISVLHNNGIMNWAASFKG